MSIDKEQIKANLNILDVADRYCDIMQTGTNIKARHNPLREERTSSLFFYPETNTFHDFGNDETGDVIDFIQKAENLDFKEALGRANELLGGDAKPYNKKHALKRKKKTEISQDRLIKFVELTHEKLINDPELLAQLKKERGLTEDTAKNKYIGFNPKLVKEGKTYLPKGWIIPITTQAGEVHSLMIRRIDEQEIEKFGKYHFIGDSKDPISFSHIGFNKHVLVTEGDFDALLIEQETEDINVISLRGSGINDKLIEHLKYYPKVWLLLDNDEAGEMAAQKITEKTDNAEVISLPDGIKDLCELYQQGYNVDFFLNRAMGKNTIETGDYKIILHNDRLTKEDNESGDVENIDYGIISDSEYIGSLKDFASLCEYYHENHKEWIINYFEGMEREKAAFGC